MDIDRRRAQSAFAEYTARYNAADPKVKLKIDHTYRVAALCEAIAKSEGLSEADCSLAWLCGLLHDVGRFEQLRRYGTFDDSKSIDHAACSAEVLFVQGHIRDYVADPAEDALLKTAVAWHSAYRLPEKLSARTLLFCRLLRDADKIDIWRVNVEVPLEEIYNVTSGALYASPVTPAVMQAFLEHHAVLRALKKTPADNIIGHASLAFELNFAESFAAAARQGYLDKLLSFPSQNPETLARLAEARAELHRFLNEKAACAAEKDANT